MQPFHTINVSEMCREVVLSQGVILLDQSAAVQERKRMTVKNKGGKKRKKRQNMKKKNQKKQRKRGQSERTNENTQIYRATVEEC